MQAITAMNATASHTRSTGNGKKPSIALSPNLLLPNLRYRRSSTSPLIWINGKVAKAAVMVMGACAVGRLFDAIDAPPPLARPLARFPG
jgi:hypothetical protein